MIANLKDIKAAVIGGAIAETAFEAYAWLVSPHIFGETLEPANLVMGLFKKYLGLELPYQAAFGIHAFIGIVGFGLFTLIFYKLFHARPLLSGIFAGLTLWFVAQGILAPAMGRAFMMDFGPYTQSSFIGHVGMALIIAFFIRYHTSTQERST